MPRGFISLQHFLLSPLYSFHNVIGIVSDVMPPSKTQGTDFQLTLSLQDESCFPASVRVKYFAPESTGLPQIRDLGDVVILRQVKKMDFRGSVVAVSSNATSFIVFDGAMLQPGNDFHPPRHNGNLAPHTKSINSQSPSVQENHWARHLRSELCLPPVAPSPDKNASPPAKMIPVAACSSFSTSKKQKKFALISEVRENLFCDLTAEVLKKYITSQGYVELYVTDYSSNKDLSSHQIQSKALRKLFTSSWTPEQQKRTLKVEVHPPHSFWTMQSVAETDVVDLFNVRIKTSRSGSELEGNLWADKLHPDQMNISHTPKTNRTFKALVDRRDQLFKMVGVPRSEHTGNPQVYHVGSDYSVLAASEDDKQAFEEHEIDITDSEEAGNIGKRKRRKKLKRREAKAKAWKRNGDADRRSKYKNDSVMQNGNSKSREVSVPSATAMRLGLNANGKLYIGQCSL